MTDESHADADDAGPDKSESASSTEGDVEQNEEQQEPNASGASERTQLEVDILRDSLPSPANLSDSSDDTAQDKPSF